VSVISLGLKLKVKGIRMRKSLLSVDGSIAFEFAFDLVVQLLS